MRRLEKLVLVALITLFASVFTACQTPYYASSDERVIYDNPDWAPPYYEGVQYYYLPDIEAYFDLSLHQFIYLDNGYWRYSQVIPPMYAGFNLSDCYSVALNIGVYQPWMHHQYYISHYPRYYYRDYYDRSNIPYVRGYNENTRSAFYWKNNERNRAREWNDESIRNGRDFKYSKEDKARQIQPAQSGRSSRSSGNVNATPQQQNSGNNKVTTPRQSGNTIPRRSDNANDRGTTNDRNNVNEKEKVNANTNVNPQQQSNRSGTSKDSQNTNYYGKKIGQPVKVEKQMRSEKQNVTRSSSVKATTPAKEKTESRTNNRRK